ncbi:hypothetical protein Nepgr_012329 [Nepenthes gracilis]|uniref:Exportin-4 n=1 Tax=Nepenthes gracilis TaxID=150966 RepID=A0AAD3SFT9_NEPGR|nr:hypothetical protein Nepgr_012329 [Nepenthes gracilis]
MQGEPSDLGHLQSIMRAIELACSSIQMNFNPSEAEATILSLSQTPHPYQACKFILEHSQVADARFHAVAAVRDAALREWSVLTSVDKRSLISFCLCYVMQHASLPEGYVQTKVSSVAAQLMKRGWLEFAAAEKEAFFVEVKQSIIGRHGVDVQISGINFLASLVSEFSPSTSTAIGLPREFHEQCRVSLELDYLKTFYSWAQEAALGVTNRIVESDSAVPEAKVCTAALCLMLQILNWDFQHYSSDGARSSINVFSVDIRYNGSSAIRSECILVQLGPSWRDILISSGHVGWLLSVYGALRLKFSSEGYWLDCPIAVSARKLIVQLCSLTGTIFPSDNHQMQEHHLVQLLSGIVQWIHPPDEISKAIECGRSESEMLDGCRALLAVATITSPFVFDGLLKSICHFGTISLLSALMSNILKSPMINNPEEETWSCVARDILLDTWTALLATAECSNGIAFLPSEGISAAASLFALIVESEVKAASTSAFNDDDGSDYFQASISGMDERLSSYGLIARASIEFSVPLLTRLLSERFAWLHQGRGTADPTATLEELYSLLLICGHVLADEGEGELPLVPEAIQTQFVDITEANKHPVVILSCSILYFAEKSVDPEIRASIFSPRLMEAVIWFLARWSCTYLLPPEDNRDSNNSLVQDTSQQFRKTICDFFGEHGQGKHALDAIVRISMAALISYPGEKDLQELICRQLLRGLVRRKDICVHLLVLDSWHNLANSFANDRTFFSLNAALQRSLAQTLVLQASGMKHFEASLYVRDLMSHTTAYLVELSGKNNLISVAQLPDTIMMVSCLMERLRGAASATEPRTQKAVYDLGISVMSPVLVLIEAYKHESAVVYLLVKFVAQWVDGQIIYLEAQETAVLVNFCMSLLKLYSSHNIGQISMSRSSTLINEAKAEKFKCLRALLQLLASLCSKDLVDFSSEPIESQGISIGQVVYVGLHIITPLVSMDSLKYPKLCHDYFSLLSHMLEVYPEMVAQLNAEAFVHIMATLDFGLHHQDIEIVDKCLRALKALASYHYKETIAGRLGLGLHAAGFKDSDGKFLEGIISRFLFSLLQLLLFEDYSPDLVSAAADALLPLILCEQGLYQQLGNELIERQTDPEHKSRLANALHALVSSNRLSSTLDRINYQRFRKNLLGFLIEVRGFLRKA